MSALGEERFAEVRASLAANGTNELDRDAFLLNAAAGNLLRDLVPEDAPAEAAAAYGALLHMLYLGWSRDWPVADVPADRLRAALEHPAPLAARTPPTAICYVRLPERLCWGEPDRGQPHEPLDGLFVVAAPDRVRTVAVLGLRDGREGFTTMESELRLPCPPPRFRDDASAPFASVLPGGDRARLHSVVDPHELGALALFALAAAEG